MELENLIELLKKNMPIPISYGWFDENIKGTHLTFFVLSEKPYFFDDDDFDYIKQTFQFDIWSQSENPYKYYPQLRELLKSNGFNYITMQGFNEKENNIFHLALRFEITKQDVLINEVKK